MSVKLSLIVWGFKKSEKDHFLGFNFLSADKAWFLTPKLESYFANLYDI